MPQKEHFLRSGLEMGRFIFFKLFFSFFGGGLFIFERERQREGDTDPLGSALTAQRALCGARAHESRDHDLS